MANKRLPVAEPEGTFRFPTACLRNARFQPLGEPLEVLVAGVARQRLDGTTVERVVAHGQLPSTV